MNGSLQVETIWLRFPLEVGEQVHGSTCIGSLRHPIQREPIETSAVRRWWAETGLQPPSDGAFGGEGAAAMAGPLRDEPAHGDGGGVARPEIAFVADRLAVDQLAPRTWD